MYLHAGRLLLEVVNKTPNKDAFHFAKIADGLHKAGQYMLQFLLLPALPLQPPQTAQLSLTVVPGPAATICLSVGALSRLRAHSGKREGLEFAGSCCSHQHMGSPVMAMLCVDLLCWA